MGGARAAFLPNGPPKLRARVNASSANLMAILSGTGLGALPTYLEAVRDDLVMLDVAPPYPLDIWITYHADAKKSPRVRKAIEWLTDCFRSAASSWFRDEFVHPRKFARRISRQEEPGMPPHRKSRPMKGPHITVVEPRLLTDWEAAHVFLEVARSRSFRRGVRSCINPSMRCGARWTRWKRGWVLPCCCDAPVAWR